MTKITSIVPKSTILEGLTKLLKLSLQDWTFKYHALREK